MDEGAALYTISAFFVPLGVGSSVSRAAWPAHVTVAGNFSTSAAPDGVVNALHGAAPRFGDIRVGRTARFGVDGSIPVLLVESDWLVALHMRLAGELELLEGFLASEPQFWRGGFLPHVTQGTNVLVGCGSSAVVRSIAVSQLGERDALVVGECIEPP